MSRQISTRGRSHVAGWEAEPGGKPALVAYYDGGRVPTIGFGHTRGVKMGMTCTEAQAYAWLDEDLDEAERAVDTLVRVPLNDNQFAALVSFVFNVGVTAFAGSTLLRLLNAGNYAAVPAQLMRWVKDDDPKRPGKKITVPGLVNRRTADAALWSAPMLGEATNRPLVLHDPTETGRRPSPPPAPTGVLGTSTGKAQALALTAGSTAGALELVTKDDGMLDTLREALPQLEALSYVFEGAKVLFVVGTLVLIGWTLWDRHRKLKETGQ